MEFHFNDVNIAFNTLVRYLDLNKDAPHAIRASNSRNGKVYRFVEPVTITFVNPQRRVLFNYKRDCNPFFHLFESIWMLAGDNRVEPVQHFASNIGNYSDDGKTFHGAYGCRWRSWFGYDQLNDIIKELSSNPDSRRCVLSMWDGSTDVYPEQSGRPEGAYTESDLHMAVYGGGKDVPCNTHAYFEIVPHEDGGYDQLNMTVCNRSNDLVWGLLGANVVHFSYLLEYMANSIGVHIGEQRHFTNNLHVYTENNSGFKPDEWLSGVEYNPYGYPDEITSLGVPGIDEMNHLVNHYDNLTVHQYDNEFLSHVVSPAMSAFNFHKIRDYDMAIQVSSEIRSADWRNACTNWIQRRFMNWINK